MAFDTKLLQGAGTWAIAEAPLSLMHDLFINQTIIPIPKFSHLLLLPNSFLMH